MPLCRPDRFLAQESGEYYRTFKNRCAALRDAKRGVVLTGLNPIRIYEGFWQTGSPPHVGTEPETPHKGVCREST